LIGSICIGFQASAGPKLKKKQTEKWQTEKCRTENAGRKMADRKMADRKMPDRKMPDRKARKYQPSVPIFLTDIFLSAL
jgi:hypothetical protein